MAEKSFNILAVDQSLTGTGVVTVSLPFEYKLTEEANSYGLELPSVTAQTLKAPSKSKGIHRLNCLNNMLERVLRSFEPNVVIMEGYSFGSKGASLFQLGELGGAFRLTINKWLTENIDNPKFYVVPPTTLKKFVTGKGNSNKGVMLMHTFKKFGVEFSDDNQCDAYGLAQMAIARNFSCKIATGYSGEKVKLLTEYEKEAINTMKSEFCSISSNPYRIRRRS